MANNWRTFTMMFDTYLYPQKPNSKPQGAIDIEFITEIKTISSKAFIIGYPGRDFELKAKTKEECEAWIAALNVTKVKLLEKRVAEALPKEQMSPQSNPKSEPGSKRSSSKVWKVIDP
jgi:hypothetical protein